MERQFDKLTLSGHAQVVAYADDGIAVPVAFVGSGTTLSITGASPGAVGGQAGGALDLRLSDKVSAFSAFDLKVRGGSVTYSGMLGLQGTF